MLVDDHAMLREGLRDKFAAAKDIKVQAEAGSGKEALSALAAHPADVVLMDITLPDGNGIDFMQTIKKKYPRCKVLMMTMYDKECYVARALEQGADGYVVKGASFKELLEGVRQVAAGKRYVSSAIALRMDARSKLTGPAPVIESLSPREFEVLIHLCKDSQPIKQIADELGISLKSVSTYQTRLMKKLGLSSKPELIKFAVEAGVV